MKEEIFETDIVARKLVSRLDKTGEAMGKEYWRLLKDARILRQHYEDSNNLETTETEEINAICKSKYKKIVIDEIREKVKKIILLEISAGNFNSPEKSVFLAKRLAFLKTIYDTNEWIEELMQKIEEFEILGMLKPEQVFKSIRLIKYLPGNEEKEIRKYLNSCRRIKKKYV